MVVVVEINESAPGIDMTSPCQYPVPVGLEKHYIPDENIWTTSQINALRGAKFARLNGYRGMQHHSWFYLIIIFWNSRNFFCPVWGAEYCDVYHVCTHLLSVCACLCVWLSAQISADKSTFLVKKETTAEPCSREIGVLWSLPTLFYILSVFSKLSGVIRNPWSAFGI